MTGFLVVIAFLVIICELPVMETRLPWRYPTMPVDKVKDTEIKQLIARLGLRTVDPEIYMDATELVTSKGYPVENHYVTTEDGYILNLIRIPHGRNNSHVKGPRPVVVLQHGLFGSCSNFLTNLVNQSLAYILADAGADVWLGNSRGNYYSTNHTHLCPQHKPFWEFSWDEMAKYDLPATIYYILAVTKADGVYYVGHSQGTTIGFIKFGEDERLASHIKHFFAFAPVAQVWHTKSVLRKLVPEKDKIAEFMDRISPGTIKVEPSVLRFFAKECQKFGLVICTNILFSMGGYDTQSFNVSRLPVYLSHNPAGTSVRNLLHWAQLVQAKSFQAFDFGTDLENIKHYGQKTPPLYDPTKIQVPVAIFRGDNDAVATPEDVSWLLPQLNVTHDVRIQHYNHLDFIWAIDASQLLYNTILNVIFQ